ncbi:MAG: hypothetical protein WC069_06225 [Candidatus Shapirobacteria bacterium]
MPLAFLKTNFAKTSIDRDSGIIFGVRVMEVGKLAQFNTTGAGVRKVSLSSRHVDALMAHAGNRSIAMHLTHDWLDAKSEKDTVEMKSRIGALKNFRKDESGNLIADAYLKSGEHRDSILWAAEHDTDNNMLSAVFGFAKDDPLCLPVNFKAADLVSQGAGTTALLADASEENKTMDIKELLEMLKDPEVAAAIASLIPQSTSDPSPAEAEAAMKKSIDVAVTAALASHKPTLTEDQETALLKKAEAGFVAKLGSGGFVKDFSITKNPGEMPFVARLAKHEATGATRAVAILRAKNDSPAEFNAWETAGRPMPTAA